MSAIQIGQQIAFLRKQEQITQEELAQALGVTNQAVSKWESGACCPDITLLPQIAAYFKVSVDELLGYRPADSLNDVSLKIKGLFQSTPAEECFDLAYKLAFVLHEGAVTHGYKGYVPWDTSKERLADEALYHWGYSACSEPEGITVMKRSTVVIASEKYHTPMSSGDVQEVLNALQRLGSWQTLRVLYVLYELTFRDYSVYLTPEEIGRACDLPIDAVQRALDWLPVQIKTAEDGKARCRLDNACMHIPTILSLLTR